MFSPKPEGRQMISVRDKPVKRQNALPQTAGTLATLGNLLSAGRIDRQIFDSIAVNGSHIFRGLA